MSSGSKKYYGVRVGRDGHRIYRNWAECFKAVNGFPSAKYKGFRTLQDATDWVFEDASFDDEPPSSSSSTLATSQNPSPETPGIPKKELFVPGLYYADPNPEHSLGGDEVDFIPLPTSSPIKYLPTQSNGVSNSSSVEQSEDHEACLVSDGKAQRSLGPPQLKEEKPVGPPLSTQQQEVLNRILRGESVFFTGSAGTGKSVLLRAIISALGGPSPHLAITASTGIAAVNIGGCTLHSFAGCGLAKGPVEELVGKIRGQKTLKHVFDRWERTKTLIVDEISMIDGSFFDKLECIARQLRNNNEPFGGIQLVLSGDFCQLPPVSDHHDGAPVPIIFAFDAKSWTSCVGRPIVLNKIFRQNDPDFVRMLDSMRYGRLDEASIKRFKKLRRPVVYDDGIEATELYPRRYQVETANARRMDSLSGPSHTYLANDTPGIDIRGNPMPRQQAEQLLDRLVAVKELTLKVGAQVMLIKNIIQTILVNGSLGKVEAFMTAAEAREKLIEIPQFEGKDAAESDGNLSKFVDPPRTTVKQEQGVARSTGETSSQGARFWPVVRFTNGRQVLCIPSEFRVESAAGTLEAKREQVPLILAWAISVHKSQGQTIERVKVDLGTTFEKGQAYVALSRATSINTLQILNFDKSKVMAHPRVLEWYSQLFQRLEEEEEWEILREMEDESALLAFFEDDP